MSVIYDKAKYHFEAVIEAGLNIKSAYTHGGLLLAWLIENELVSKDFILQNRNEIQKLKNGEISGPQLYINIDGVLSDVELNENGTEFLNFYYNDNYIENYVSLFDNYTSIYNVSDTEENYKKLASILNSHFASWQISRIKQSANKFDNLQEFTLKILPKDFKFLKKDKYGLLFVKEDEKLVQGFRIYINDEEFKNVSVFVSNKIIMSFFDSSEGEYSDWILGAREHDFLFGTKFNERLPSNDTLSLNSEEQMNKIVVFIEEYVKNKANTFFEYWESITDILPFLETNDNGFVSDVFSGYGFYKKIIVWKLCSHPKYEELANEMLNIFSQELKDSPNDKLLKKDYDLYVKILKKLETITPFYSWSDNYLIKKNELQ